MFTHVSRGRELGIGLLLLATSLAACSPGGRAAGTATPAARATTAEATAVPKPTLPPAEPTASPPQPTATAVPATEPPTPAAAETPTAPATVEHTEIIPVGSTADWTATLDPVGIDGVVEVIDVNKVRISNFVFLAAEAPGVDIRLGLDGDFSDVAAVVLKDITGQVYEGRSLTLTIPDAAFDGRAFDSISVFCFETGEIFDWALFETP